MSARRVLGIETEYGISVLGHSEANPMTTSSQVVNAYATEHTRMRRPSWDFEEENPLRDARGFDLGRDLADPSLLTDEDVGMANVILTNGARLYVDHAHPEYSSPEVIGPRAAVAWDKAGEQVMAAAAAAASRLHGRTFALYKNNTDNKGASYGCHENYLMRRSTSFASIVRTLVPFFVSRQVVCGAGRVGLGADGAEVGYQLSQRADFIEVEVGLETTLKRPIVNTRDEPHADAATYRRLHVIVGDANLSEVATFLKLGTTSLVLDMLEAGWPDEGVALRDPVAAIRTISHDPSLRATVELDDGRQVSGLDLQYWYLDRVRAFLRSGHGAERGNPPDADPETEDVLVRWQQVLDDLARDPMACADRLDWVAKLSLLEGYRARDGLAWADPKLALVDLQYADVRPEKGLYRRLESRGRMQRVLDDREAEAAVQHPPEDTRAYFRGRCLDKYAEHVAAASWDSVIFDIPGRAALQRVPTMEPLRGTRQHVGGLLDRCASAEELVDALTGR